MRRQARAGMPSEKDLPACGTVDSREDVEEGGLACTVGTDQPDQFPGFDPQRDIT